MQRMLPQPIYRSTIISETESATNIAQSTTTTTTRVSNANMPCLVLHMPPAPEAPPGHIVGSTSQTESTSTTPSISTSTTHEGALPAQVEMAIQRRIQACILYGSNLYNNTPEVQALVQELGSSPLLNVQAREELADWVETFSNLHPRDRQTQADALALLVLHLIRPIMLESQEESAEQDQALTWELAVEAILIQMLPGLQFEVFVDECAALMSERRLIQALCERVDQTRAAENSALTSLFTEVQAQITHVFTSLRQKLIIIQQARAGRVEEQDAAVEALGDRAYQAAQELEEVATAVSRLAVDINNAQERAESIYAHGKHILSRLT